MYLTIALIASAFAAVSMLTLLYALSRIRKLERAMEGLTPKSPEDASKVTSPRGRRRWQHQNLVASRLPG